MMAAERMDNGLIDRLPEVRGRMRANEPLARYTWFRVGGPADVFYEPADLDDLEQFMSNKADDVPVTVLGGTSNILIRDGGIRGVTIRLGKPFADIDIKGEHVHVGAAAADVNVARRAAGFGVEGLEFLVGIPGTIGGALRMNAGAYGAEIKDVFESATAIDGSGALKTLNLEDMGFAYRHSDIPDDFIFTSAVLKGAPGDEAEIQKRMTDIQASREATQPVRERTGGSTFANPDGYKAWELVDQAGCRGLRIGDAMVSDAHTNFLINIGNARAQDLELLGEEVRRRVLERSGIELKWEIRRVGELATSELHEVTS